MANWRIRKKLKFPNVQKKKMRRGSTLSGLCWWIIYFIVRYQKRPPAENLLLIFQILFPTDRPNIYWDGEKRLNRADMELWNSPALGILCVALSGIVQKPYIRYSSLEAKGTDQNSQTCLGDALGVVGILKRHLNQACPLGTRVLLCSPTNFPKFDYFSPCMWHWKIGF